MVAAGGLGTRVHGWARFIPKEFYPVDGRPGLVHLLEEIAALGPARVVIVYHPYYEAFAAWARQVLSEHGQARYARLADRDFGVTLPPCLAISFVPQRGPYADLTSVMNGADHHACPDELYVAFADNLYRGPNPLVALHRVAPGQVAVLASRYRPELAASHGVIAAPGKPGLRLMTGLAEKPGPAQARAFERRYGSVAACSCWKAAPASPPPSSISPVPVYRRLASSRSWHWSLRPSPHLIRSRSWRPARMSPISAPWPPQIQTILLSPKAPGSPGQPASPAQRPVPGAPADEASPLPHQPVAGAFPAAPAACRRTARTGWTAPAARHNEPVRLRLRSIGVLSLPAVSVWTNGRVLWWRADGAENGWPAADPEGAADQLTGLAATPGDLAPPRDASPPCVRRLRPSSRAVTSAPTGKIRRWRFAFHLFARRGH